MKRQIELSRATAYTGTCADMCPERERGSRLGFQLSIFERDQEDQPDECLMVKEYRRAGADQEEPAPDDLRTPGALNATMDHLVFNIMDDDRSLSPDLALDWYDFLWDRLRAIRKDITQQNICDQSAAILVERCTRFHVHSCYAMNSVKDFDVDMNKRNLNDCLQMLRQMYEDLKEEGIVCDGELEFQKYNILLHLDEDPLSTTVLMKTSNQRSSMEMKVIIRIFNAYLNNDYYTFFQLMLRADYMISSILSLYVNSVRLKAMKILLTSCTSRQTVLYPADLIIETLAFDGLNDLNNFVSMLGIQLQEKHCRYFLMLNKDLLRHIDRATLPPFKSERLVEDKMSDKSVGELVYGDSQPSRQLPDGTQPLTPRQLHDGHLEPVSTPTETPGVIKHTLKVDDARPLDAGAYHLKTKNPEGAVESEPVNLRIDRSMGPRDEPKVTPAAAAPDTQAAPKIERMPEEVAAGIGSNPQIEAEVSGNPKPDVTWYKVGKPITERQLIDGVLEIVDLPADRPDVVEQQLRIDRSMGPRDDTKVTESTSMDVDEDQQPEATKTNPQDQQRRISNKQHDCAKLMPAGRFRRKTLARANRHQGKQCPPPRPIAPAPTRSAICKPSTNYYKRKVEERRQAIKHESQANVKLLELLKVFIQ